MMMPPSELARRLDRIGRRQWWIDVVVRSTWLALAVVVGTSLLLCLAYWLRSWEFFRWIGFGAWWLGLALGFRYWLYPALLRPVVRVATAQRIEDRLQLGRGWLSGVAGLELEGASRWVGSMELLDHAVQIANHRFQDEPLEDVQEYRKILRWLPGTLLAGLLFVASIVFLQPARLAAQRLATPWASIPWPQLVQLAFVELPDKVSKGSTLEIQVRNLRGDVPADVQVLRRAKGLPGESPSMLTTRTVPLRIQNGIAFSQLFRLESDVEVRAVGGDDTRMPWRSIRLGLPTRLVTFQFDLIGPEYLGSVARQTSSAEIQLLSGTRIRMSGTFSSPIQELAFHGTEGHASLAQTRFELSEDRLSFRTHGPVEEWIRPAESVRFGLKWLTQDGIAGSTPITWRWHVAADAPPEVSVSQPVDPYSMTPAGVLPIQFQCSDDHGLQSIRLCLSPADSENHKQVTLDVADGGTWRAPADNQGWDSNQRWRDEQVIQWQVAGRWQPAWSPLPVPDEAWMFWIECVDRLGQKAASKRRMVQIVDRDFVAKQFDQNQVSILELLRQSLAEHQKAMHVFPNRPPDVLKLERASRSILSGNESSLLARLEKQLELLALNQMTEAREYAIARQLRESVTTLVQDDYQPLELSLERMIKINGASKSNRAAEDIPRTQRRIEERLQRWVLQLATAADARGYFEQIERLARQQGELGNATGQLAQETRADRVSAQTQAGEAAQLELARQIDQIQAELNSRQSSSRQSRQAVELLRQLSQRSIAARMREAAQQLRQSQWDKAREAQYDIAQQLTRSIADTGDAAEQQGAEERPSSPSEDEALAKKRAMAEVLSGLIEKQTKIHQQVGQWTQMLQGLQEPGQVPMPDEVSRTAQVQRDLADDLANHWKLVEREPTLMWVGKATEMEMRKGSASLQRMRILEPAARHVRAALRHLQALHRALETELAQSAADSKSSKEPRSTETAPGGKGEDDARPPSALQDSNQSPKGPSLASLLVLRDLQQYVQQRLESLQAEATSRSSANDWTEEQWLEIRELARFQQAISQQLPGASKGE
jgi:hypothetical protein